MAHKRHNPAAGRARGRREHTHTPVLLREVLAALAPRPGEVVVDCTLGYGGHAAALARRVLPGGRLIGLDRDRLELDRTRRRLEAQRLPIATCHANFSQIAAALAEHGADRCDVILADLGVSSMQIDDPSRGISYKHDNAPLDMRMNTDAGPTAAELLLTLDEAELSAALRDLADEPDHQRIAQWLVRQRQVLPIATTGQLKELVFAAKGTVEKLWKKQADYHDAHPAMRTFQALRILVNDELAALGKLLEAAPSLLRPGGRIGIISFHSGEDRLVKNAFRDGYASGRYAAFSGQPIRPTGQEVRQNPRSSSAKFRWARLAGPPAPLPGSDQSERCDD